MNMIRINNLDKRYNKNRPNEIHVINNISLELQEKGLIALLGPSGSGKSTLLNAIGGLDKVDKGSIEIDGTVLNKYKSAEWDHLRNKHIGYIFQNYILLEDQTVYENIYFALLLTGIHKDLIDERIEYALRAVKMEKFAKRKARNLSGGQQQRVAIARALAKSPDIIIADEPTGNLDAQNSTQIMNIIKHISKECLVILVTHNVQLANFYADRIIQLKDGSVIEDYENTSSEALDLHDDRNIYLGELQQETISLDALEVSYYHDQSPVKPEIAIIVQDNVVYVYHKNSQQKIKLLTPKDEVKVLEGSKIPMEKTQMEEVDYTLPKITSTKTSYHSVVSFKESFKMALKRLQGMRKIQKLFLGSFVLAAILIVISVANILGTLAIDYEAIIQEDKNVLQIEYRTSTADSFMPGILNRLATLKTETPEFSYFLFDSAIKGYGLNISADIYAQTSGMQISVSGAFIYAESLTEDDILYGRLPEESDEVVIDVWLTNQFVKQYDFAMTGFVRAQDFIGRTLNIGSQRALKVVGIVDTNSPSFYIPSQTHISIQRQRLGILADTNTDAYTSTYTQELLVDEILIPEGLYPEGTSMISMHGISYTVKGTFQSLVGYREFVANDETFERMMLANAIRNRELKMYSSQKNISYQALSEDEFFKVVDAWDVAVAEYRAENRDVIISQLVMAGVILGASLIFLYFIIRSSMIERIKEIGTYRSLGVTKKDIFKMFVSEIFVVSLFSSFIGWLLITWVMYQQGGSMLLSGLYYPPLAAGLILLGLFGINIVIGLLPVRKLLSQTPAQIMSKYDI